MTMFSHSRVETFETCPYCYKLRYEDGLNTLPNDDPANALFLGTALHTGIEQGVKAGIKSYFDSYPVITDLHINESLKLEHWIPKVQDLVFQLCGNNQPVFERKILHPDLIGFMDLLIPVGMSGNTKLFALYDFKYSNHVDRYLESRQLHEYKYFYEKVNPYHKIVEMGFIFIPKTAIRQKKTEDLSQFRKRLKETLASQEIRVVKVDYDPKKVIEFYQHIKEILETKDFPKKECKLCDFCEFKDFCQQGVDYMLLPKNERRVINASSRKKVWLYGAPFSGKTTLADNFPSPIMLNTDGNLNSFTSPVIEIKETLEGRQKISAWDNFKSAIDELQKGSDFETIVVDLVEDTYEHCRRYCYEKLGIEHESDNSFKAWDYVRNEFLTTLKKLMTLDYNIVLISHEDMSKDIMKKSGDKITSIRPNIADKVANKLAGMVDIVARVVADGDNERTLQFKSDDVVFGGGRLKLTKTLIPLTYSAFESVYESQVAPKTEEVKTVETKQTETKQNESETKPQETQPETSGEDAPRRRRRRTKAEMEAARAEEEDKPAEGDEAKAEETAEENKPTEAESLFGEEEKPVVTLAEANEYARKVCKKYGTEELSKVVSERFGIRSWRQLEENQASDVLKVIKDYEAYKDGKASSF